jgi:hypothetical protein
LRVHWKNPIRCPAAVPSFGWEIFSPSVASVRIMQEEINETTVLLVGKLR